LGGIAEVKLLSLSGAKAFLFYPKAHNFTGKEFHPID